jgi:hypothetical protein
VKGMEAGATASAFLVPSRRRSAMQISWSWLALAAGAVRVRDCGLGLGLGFCACFGFLRTGFGRTAKRYFGRS